MIEGYSYLLFLESYWLPITPSVKQAGFFKPSGNIDIMSFLLS